MSLHSIASMSLMAEALRSRITATPRSVSDLIRRPMDCLIFLVAGMMDTNSLPSPNLAS